MKAAYNKEIHVRVDRDLLALLREEVQRRSTKGAELGLSQVVRALLYEALDRKGS